MALSSQEAAGRRRGALVTQVSLPNGVAKHEGAKPRIGQPLRGRERPVGARWRITGAVAAIVTMTAPVGAQPATDQIWWACAPIDKLDTYAATGERFTLNNFRLREDVGFASRRPFAEFSFSAVNRSDKPLYLTAQVLAFAADQQEIVLAFSLEPPFGMVPSQTTTQMKASVNVMPGELETIRQVCLRVDA